MSKVLMKIVLDSLAFFELADDSAIDQDVAVAQMEAIAANLRQLNPQERKEFLSFVSEQAESLRRDPTARRYVSFLDNLPEALSLN